MNTYSIYCTESQTRKAFELGAPIEKKIVTYTHTEPTGLEEDYDIESSELKIPTAEEMLGWLRTKDFRFKFVEYEGVVAWKIAAPDWFIYADCNSIEDAYLAAIDAALEYLTNNK